MSTFAGRTTVRDTLASYGSSNLSLRLGSSSLKLTIHPNKLANPFAPFPLQKLHHYYPDRLSGPSLTASLFGLAGIARLYLSLGI
ncbi:MAG TPA: hypothetical protein VIM16_11335 [Mucilaginibacter sp.]